ncbi:MAG TPA: hypothetical protein VIX35_05745 [Vicinamibacterales bacterium]
MPRATLYPSVASIKMSTEQLRLINQRAKHCGVRPSVWMRTVLMQAAQSAARGVGDGYIRIREPNGVTT